MLPLLLFCLATRQDCPPVFAAAAAEARAPADLRAVLKTLGVGGLAPSAGGGDLAGQALAIPLPGLPAGAKQLELVVVPGSGSAPPVFMGKYEITQGQYAAVTGQNPSLFKKGPDYPVEQVTWEEAKEFCRRLTEALPDEFKARLVFRLPTDAEWSLAVGLPEEAGNTPREKDGKINNRFPWGTQWPPPKGAGNYGDLSARNKTPRRADFSPGTWPRTSGDDDGYAETAPVGSFQPNQHGQYDLGGNVWEWCEDGYDNDQAARVLRGASWNRKDRSRLLSSHRYYGYSGFRLDSYGFRVVLGASGAGAASK